MGAGTVGGRCLFDEIEERNSACTGTHTIIKWKSVMVFYCTGQRGVLGDRDIFAFLPDYLPVKNHRFLKKIDSVGSELVFSANRRWFCEPQVVLLVFYRRGAYVDRLSLVFLPAWTTHPGSSKKPAEPTLRTGVCPPRWQKNRPSSPRRQKKAHATMHFGQRQLKKKTMPQTISSVKEL